MNNHCELKLLIFAGKQKVFIYLSTMSVQISSRGGVDIFTSEAGSVTFESLTSEFKDAECLNKSKVVSGGLLHAFEQILLEQGVHGQARMILEDAAEGNNI